MNSFSQTTRAITRVASDTALACLPAAIGGTIFALLSLPAAWLTGGLLFSSAAAIALKPPQIHSTSKTIAIILLGIAIGASVTAEALTNWTKWPASLVVLVFAVIAMLAAPYAVLRWIYHWCPATAFWAASPGALTASLALAEEAGADMKAVVAIHLVRVLAVSLLVPFLVPAPEGAYLASQSSTFNLADFTLLLVAASAMGWSFKAAAIPGGTLLGAFAATAALAASGMVAFSMPPAITASACVVFAASIGVQFAGVNLATLSRLLTASLACLAAAMAVSFLFAFGASALLGVPFTQALISYAPGGIDVLILVAFMLGADPAFVSAHQFVRLTALVLLLPFVGRLVCGSSRGTSSEKAATGSTRE